MAKKKSAGNDDISNKTVLAVLVLVVLVSVVSLVVYMDALDDAQPNVLGKSSGEVSLTIMEPEAPSDDGVDVDAGKATLTIE